MTTYDLGVLTGGRYRQISDAIGQHIYIDTVIGSQSRAIPLGFEDHEGVSFDCLHVFKGIKYATDTRIGYMGA